MESTKNMFVISDICRYCIYSILQVLMEESCSDLVEFLQLY